MPSIVLTTSIPAPARECFDLSLSVDAHTRSMAHSNERIVAGVRAGVMRLGDTVTWRARHFGVAFTMTSRITEYDAPHHFVDEQASGPFRHWSHRHVFAEDDGVTLMTDVVEFASPLGPVGRAVDALFLTGYLRRLLIKRNRWLVGALS